VNLGNDNAFWRFSLAVYSAPGVSAECITLQDGSRVDVNVLLFAAWLGAMRGLVLTPEHFKAIEAVIGEWQRGILAPVREIRRRIKAMPDIDDELYEQVKATELRLEQVEQSRLYALSEALQGRTEPAEGAIRSNIASYVRRAGTNYTPEALIAAAIAQL